MLPSPSTEQYDLWVKSVNGKHGRESYANKAEKASSPTKHVGSGSCKTNRFNHDSKNNKPTSDEEKNFFPPLFLFNKECPHKVTNLDICQAAADSLQLWQLKGLGPYGICFLKQWKLEHS